MENVSNSEIIVSEHSGSAVQHAIDAVSAAGGGRVVVPSGVTVCGTLYLKSNVELHLPQGAVLKASRNLADYNPEDAYPENYGCKAEEWRGLHFIIAYHLENVSITGPGTIDGSGDAFFEPRIPDKGFGYGWRYGFSWSKDKVNLRPGQLICFIRCKNIRVTDLNLENYPCWGCFFHGSVKISVRGLHIYNPKHFVNTDGLDIDCCRDVVVSDCMIDTGDDAIAIRGSCRNLGENAFPCENLRILNCILSSASSVFRIGVGDGIIRNVDISGITMTAGDVGVNIQPQFGEARPGGVDISGIRLHDISMKNVAYPFGISSGPEIAAHGRVRDVFISNVFVESYMPSEIICSRENAIDSIQIENSFFRIVPPPELPEVKLPEQETYFMKLHGKGHALIRNTVFESRISKKVSGFSAVNGFDCKISGI